MKQYNFNSRLLQYFPEQQDGIKDKNWNILVMFDIF